MYAFINDRYYQIEIDEWIDDDYVFVSFFKNNQEYMATIKYLEITHVSPQLESGYDKLFQ